MFCSANDDYLGIDGQVADRDFVLAAFELREWNLVRRWRWTGLVKMNNSAKGRAVIKINRKIGFVLRIRRVGSLPRELRT